MDRALRAARIPLLALAVLSSAGLMEAHAQGRKAVLGTWTLSLRESVFGNSRGPSSATLNLTKADSSLVMISTQDLGGGEGPQAVTMDVPIDGSEHKIETERGSALVRVTWDGDRLVIWRKTQANVGKVEVTDLFNNVGSDRLEVARTIVAPDMGTFEMKLVYLRQSS